MANPARVKKATLVTMLQNKVAPSDWEQHTKKIDSLCKDLSDKVNEAIAYSSHTQANIR